MLDYSARTDTPMELAVSLGLRRLSVGLEGATVPMEHLRRALAGM